MLLDVEELEEELLALPAGAGFAGAFIFIGDTLSRTKTAAVGNLSTDEEYDDAEEGDDGKHEGIDESVDGLLATTLVRGISKRKVVGSSSFKSAKSEAFA